MLDPDAPTIFRSSAGAVRRGADAALDLDGRVALVAVRRLMSEDLPWLEERAIRLARLEGRSWAQIARLLGRTRQSVWARFRHVDRRPMTPPLPPATYEERVLNAYRNAAVQDRRRREFEELDPRHVVPW